MTAYARCTRAVLTSLFIVFLASSVLAQQPLKFDAATVSGLPARNIGSATMSGRIAALDAVVRNGRLTMFVGSASGGVWKSVNGGKLSSRFLIARMYSRSARWRLTLRILRSFGWEPASLGCATVFPLVMAFTSQPTAARTGRTSA